MSDSPLSCDFPETDIEQQLEKRFYRTHDERLASPPARMVDGVSDSSHELSYAIAFINDRFVDIRTAFLEFRRFQLVPVNIFMIVVLAIMWFVGQFFHGAFSATAALLLPLWGTIYLFEILFPLTLPVRIDRQEKYVYVGHRGTFYRIPWDELEVSFSQSLQYLGSGVVWETQYFAHIYMREKHYFCGKRPKRSLQRKKIFSGFNQDDMYKKWNFLVRYVCEGLVDEDSEHLSKINYDSYRNKVGIKSFRVFIIDHFFYILFIPGFIWWKYTPFKYRWPKEIEFIFGKFNFY